MGAAFVAVGVVSAVFAAIRRKQDLLLIYFALFAAFYGLRLWVQATLLGITVQGSPFYIRLRSGIDYIILIPAFLFFNSLELPMLFDRRMVTCAGVVLGTGLTLATFIFGPSNSYSVINSIIVIAAVTVLGFFMVHTGRSHPREAPQDYGER